MPAADPAATDPAATSRAPPAQSILYNDAAYVSHAAPNNDGRSTLDGNKRVKNDPYSSVEHRSSVETEAVPLNRPGAPSPQIHTGWARRNLPKCGTVNAISPRSEL